MFWEYDSRALKEASVYSRCNDSVAVMLFGGEAVQATVASFKVMNERNENLLKDALDKWKVSS